MKVRVIRDFVSDVWFVAGGEKSQRVHQVQPPAEEVHRYHSPKGKSNYFHAGGVVHTAGGLI